MAHRPHRLLSRLPKHGLNYAIMNAQESRHPCTYTFFFTLVHCPVTPKSKPHEDVEPRRNGQQPQQPQPKKTDRLICMMVSFVFLMLMCHATTTIQGGFPPTALLQVSYGSSSFRVESGGAIGNGGIGFISLCTNERAGQIDSHKTREHTFCVHSRFPAQRLGPVDWAHQSCLPPNGWWSLSTLQPWFLFFFIHHSSLVVLLSLLLLLAP